MKRIQAFRLLLLLCLTMVTSSTVAMAQEELVLRGERWYDKVAMVEVQYGQTAAADLNLMALPNHNAACIAVIEQEGTPLRIAGRVTVSSGQTWYYVFCGDTDGYIRDHHIMDITLAEYENLLKTLETQRAADFLQMVWIPTNGGAKYHNASTCSGMRDPAHVTLEAATSQGFTPCKRCH